MYFYCKETSNFLLRYALLFYIQNFTAILKEIWEWKFFVLMEKYWTNLFVNGEPYLIRRKNKKKYALGLVWNHFYNLHAKKAVTVFKDELTNKIILRPDLWIGFNGLIIEKIEKQIWKEGSKTIWKQRSTNQTNNKKVRPNLGTCQFFIILKCFNIPFSLFWMTFEFKT